MCSHSAPESNAAYQVLSSSIRSGNFKSPFSWAGLGKKCACTIPDGENMHEDSMYSWSSFQLSSAPQWQLSASAKHSGTRSWRHGSGCGILHWQIYTIVRPPDGKCKCVRARTQYVARRLSLPGLIVMTFQRLSSRRIQSSRSSETFACPAWDRDEYLQGFANSKSSSTLARGVTLLHNRDLQRYTGRQRCNSSKTKAKSFYRRPPKHSKTALFLFFSIVGL